jgi:hypothetical protein
MVRSIWVALIFLIGLCSLALLKVGGSLIAASDATPEAAVAVAATTQALASDVSAKDALLKDALAKDAPSNEVLAKADKLSGSVDDVPDRKLITPIKIIPPSAATPAPVEGKIAGRRWRNAYAEERGRGGRHHRGAWTRHHHAHTYGHRHRR